MNLQPQAEAEQERRTRSKLEAHREAIFALRRKHWSHRQIAKWLIGQVIEHDFDSAGLRLYAKEIGMDEQHPSRTL